MQQIELKELSTHLKDMISTALGGEIVLITQEHKPLLKLMHVDQPQARRKRGSAKGLIYIADDFNLPLEDFHQYMQ